MTVTLTLKVGDRFWLDDCDYAYTALRILVDPADCECFYVMTDPNEPPLLICAEDIVEILR